MSSLWIYGRKDCACENLRIYYNTSDSASTTSAIQFVDNQDYLFTATGDNAQLSGYRIWTDPQTTIQAATQPTYIDWTTYNHNQQSMRYNFNFSESPKPLTPEDLKCIEEVAKKERERLLKAQEAAHELLETLVPEEKIIQLQKERRIELIARNGKIYEILEDGRVNRLLPDGKKQGLCINVTNGPYPADDIIIAKLLLLENNPDKFEEIANKVSPFELIKIS